MKRYLSILLILLFAPAFAEYQVDLDRNSVSVCPSNFEIINLNLLNYGSQDSYSLSTSGSAADFTSITHNSFQLDQSSVGSTKIYVSPDQYVKPGNYELNVIISSDKNKNKKISINVVITNCDESSLNFETTERTVCVGDTADFSGSIMNEGIWTNNYNLYSNNKYSNKISFSDSNFLIEPGVTNSFNLFFDTDEIKTYNFEVQSEYNGNQLKSNLKVNSIDCYNYDLSISEEVISSCSNSEITVPYFLENFGAENDEYKLELLGEPSWASLSKDKVYVNSNSIESSNLLLLPKLDDVGEYEIKLRSKSSSNSKVEELSLLLNLMDCRESSTTLMLNSLEACPTDVIQNKLTVSNDGEFDERVYVKVNSNEKLNFQDTEFLLNSKSQETINYEYKLPSDMSSGIYDIEFVSTFPNSNKEHTELMKLKVLSYESCYNFDVKVDNKLELNSGSSNMIPVILENKGIKPTTIKLELFGDAVSFSDLSSSIVKLDGKQTITESIFLSIPRDSINNKYNLEIISSSDDGNFDTKNIEIYTKESKMAVLKNNINNANSNVSETFYQLFNYTSMKLDNYYDYLSNSVGSINNKLIGFWYIFLILILGIIYYTISLNTNWKYDLDLLERELDERPKKENKLLSIYNKIKTRYNKNKIVKKTIKKTDKKLEISNYITKNWNKFLTWLDEEPKKKNKSLWNKFLTWLDEEPKKKVSKKKVSKKKNKSIWNKFLDWLEED